MHAMRYIAASVLVVSWGLWLGGIIAVLIGVSAIFAEFRGPDIVALTAAPMTGEIARVNDVSTGSTTAGKATSSVFRAFGLYEMGVGAGALIGIVALRLMVPSKLGTIAFVCLALAASAAALTTGVVTPKIDALRLAGETKSPEFRKLHGQSMVLYSGRTLLLLATGFMLPALLVTRRDDRVAPDGDVVKA